MNTRMATTTKRNQIIERIISFRLWNIESHYVDMVNMEIFQRSAEGILATVLIPLENFLTDTCPFVVKHIEAVLKGNILRAWATELLEGGISNERISAANAVYWHTHRDRPLTNAPASRFFFRLLFPVLLLALRMKVLRWGCYFTDNLPAPFAWPRGQELASFPMRLQSARSTPFMVWATFGKLLTAIRAFSFSEILVFVWHPAYPFCSYCTTNIGGTQNA